MRRHLTAFTLIELAIVLVIIGLLVGGVLVGQDLIKSAQINATVSDIQSYTTAAMTFRDKYGGIPGDLLSSRASAAGLTISATSPGTTGRGDGDGVLVNGNRVGVGGGCGLGGENSLFWRHLSDARMIPFTSSADGSTIDTTGFTGSIATAAAALLPLVPKLRVRDTAFMHVFGYSGINYYAIGQWTYLGDTAGLMSSDPVLTAREAAGIDGKIDDGYPSAGIVLSAIHSCTTVPPANGAANPSAANTVCYKTTAIPPAYATSSSDVADTVRCGLQIKAGF